MSDMQSRDSAGDGGSVRQKIGDLAGGLREQAGDVAHEVSRQVRGQASRLTDNAKDAAKGATERLQSAAENQKNMGADAVSGFAQAVRQAATPIEEQVPQFGEYIRRAADQIDGVSDALRQRRLGEMLEDVQDFARRQPAAFLGMTVLAGFAVVRLLKSSSSTGREAHSDMIADNEYARHIGGAASRLQDQGRQGY
jgi:uncharacterized protein YjbJ (UPF0337 family)